MHGSGQRALVGREPLGGHAAGRERGRAAALFLEQLGAQSRIGEHRLRERDRRALVAQTCRGPTHLAVRRDVGGDDDDVARDRLEDARATARPTPTSGRTRSPRRAARAPARAGASRSPGCRPRGPRSAPSPPPIQPTRAAGASAERMRAVAAGRRCAVIRPVATTTGSQLVPTRCGASSSSGMPLRTTTTRGACRTRRATSASASDTAPTSAQRRATSDSSARTAALTGRATPARADPTPCGV